MRIGIFGVGHLGKFHLNNWKKIPGIIIEGFFDPHDETAEKVAEEYQVKRFETADELIEAVDVVDVVSPTVYHYDICSKAMRKGKHVFVEKPLANTMEEARELVKLAKESNVKFQVGHVERFNPAFLALKDIAMEPMFIEVHRLAQFNPRGTDVSVILDLMIHDLDIILKLVKSNVSHISANGVAVMSDTPDIANVRIEFDNGCVANLTSSRISMKKMRKMRFFQKDAYISVDFLEQKTEIIKLHTKGEKNVFTFDIDTAKGRKTISVAQPKILEGNAIQTELTAFIEAIKNNITPPVTINDGFAAMEVAHHILDKISQQPS